MNMRQLLLRRFFSWELDEVLRATKFGETGLMKQFVEVAKADSFFSGSTYHDVKLWNMNSYDFHSPLSTVKPHVSFLQQNRSSPVTGLAFHPHRMMMACSGAGDNHISLFACDSRGGI
jgi:WD40 repeat protein